MEYRNLTRDAKPQQQGHGNMPQLATCICCGKVATLKPFYFTTNISAQVNGVYMHYDCMVEVKPTHEQCGNSQSKTLNHVDKFTIEEGEFDMVTYLTRCGYHWIKNGGAVGYNVKSVDIINENAINKIYSGMVAYGSNRPIEITFENGVSLKTRMKYANDVIELYNRLYNMKNPTGIRYEKVSEELSKLLIK